MEAVKNTFVQRLDTKIQASLPTCSFIRFNLLTSNIEGPEIWRCVAYWEGLGNYSCMIVSILRSNDRNYLIQEKLKRRQFTTKGYLKRSINRCFTNEILNIVQSSHTNKILHRIWRSIDPEMCKKMMADLPKKTDKNCRIGREPYTVNYYVFNKTSVGVLINRLHNYINIKYFPYICTIGFGWTISWFYRFWLDFRNIPFP